MECFNCKWEIFLRKLPPWERVIEIEHGTFTPLVFGTNGGMGEECCKFISKLASQLSEKQNASYSTVIAWLRTRLSIEIIKSALLCVKG